MPFLAYKFRLKPNATQVRALESQLETLRQLYNAGLAWWRDAYAAEKDGERVIPRRLKKSGDGETKLGVQETLRYVFANIRNLQIADQKAGGDGPHWLARISSVAMRDTLVHLEEAFDSFFRRVKEKAKKAGYPRFKGRNRLTSIPHNNYNSGCVLRATDGKPVLADAPESRSGYRVYLFGVGNIRVIVHRAIVGKIKTVSIVREPDGKWYAVFVALQPAREVHPKEGPTIGIDVGLEHFLTDSDGTHELNPRYLKQELKRLRRLQRSASRKMEAAKKRKQKFYECKNLQKSFRVVANLHTRVRNQRRNHHYQVANRLVDRCGSVCVEKLNVQGMLRNDKLSRAIGDAGWSSFIGILKRKAESAGVKVIEVNARGTSQTCPECNGEVRKALSVRVHRCLHCGYTAQRDHAAARVILARGIDPNGAGQTPVAHNRDICLAATPGSCGEQRSSTPHQTQLPRAAAPKRETNTPKKRTRSQVGTQPTLWPTDA